MGGASCQFRHHDAYLAGFSAVAVSAFLFGCGAKMPIVPVRVQGINATPA